MTDRELLEAAAKAAGLQHKWHADGLYVDSHCGIWNPLADDGDCARMEAACGIEIVWERERVAAFLSNETVPFTQERYDDHSGDRNKARRRAAVRAAASLGGKD